MADELVNGKNPYMMLHEYCQKHKLSLATLYRHCEVLVTTLNPEAKTKSFAPVVCSINVNSQVYESKPYASKVFLVFNLSLMPRMMQH